MKGKKYALPVARLIVVNVKPLTLTNASGCYRQWQKMAMSCISFVDENGNTVDGP